MWLHIAAQTFEMEVPSQSTVLMEFHVDEKCSQSQVDSKYAFDTFDINFCNFNFSYNNFYGFQYYCN